MLELGVIFVLAAVFGAIALVSVNPREEEDDLDQLRSLQSRMSSEKEKKTH